MLDRETCNSNRIEETILDKRLGETGVVASPVTRVAITYGGEHPREINAGAAARKEEVIVVFVNLGCGSLDGRTLDRQYDG